MKRIYDFERYEPPVLTEKKLRRESEKRKLRRQTACVALSSVLMQAAILMLARAAAGIYPLIALFCVAEVIVAATGSTVIVLIYSQKRRICQ